MRSNRTKLTLGMHARLLAQHLLQEALHTVHDPKPVASGILAAQGPQTASAAWESTGRYSLECLLQAPVLQQLCLGRCAGVPGFKCALQWPACNVRRQANLAKQGFRDLRRHGRALSSARSRLVGADMHAAPLW